MATGAGVGVGVAAGDAVATGVAVGDAVATGIVGEAWGAWSRR